MRTITLEEHFVSKRFLDTVGINLGGQRGVDLSGGELTDLADTRLRDMDASGIDLQVLSHVVPTNNLYRHGKRRHRVTQRRCLQAAAVKDRQAVAGTAGAAGP